jgi:hypothetical protein
MGHHDEQSQQHGMGQSGLQGSDKEREMLEGSPTGGMDQGTSQVGTHGNEAYEPGSDAGTTGAGYGQDSGFDRSVGDAGSVDYGVTSTGGAQQGDMTQEPYTEDDPTRSGNTGWNDRSQGEQDAGLGG